MSTKMRLVVDWVRFGEAFRAQGRGDDSTTKLLAAANDLRERAALEQSDAVMGEARDPMFCSHGGSCEQNLIDHDGAFCANLPIAPVQDDGR